MPPSTDTYDESNETGTMVVPGHVSYEGHNSYDFILAGSGWGHGSILDPLSFVDREDWQLTPSSVSHRQRKRSSSLHSLENRGSSPRQLAARLR